MSWAREEVCSVNVKNEGDRLIHTGIYAPGYAERRAERLKDAYGIEVPVSASS